MVVFDVVVTPTEAPAPAANWLLPAIVTVSARLPMVLAAAPPALDAVASAMVVTETVLVALGLIDAGRDTRVGNRNRRGDVKGCHRHGDVIAG